MPSAGGTISYSNVNTIPEFPKTKRVIDSTNGVYTCPVGYVARVSGVMVLDAVGADSHYAIAVWRYDGIEPDLGKYHPVGPLITANESSAITGKIVMNGNDKLTMIGDDGSTNGTGNIDCSVQELNA